MAKPKYKSDRNRRSGKQASVKKGPTDKPASKDKVARPVEAPPARQVHEGARLPEKMGLVLETLPNQDHALLDSGNGRKLERYGDLIIDRPEAQAIWLPSLDGSSWQSADAIFTGDTDEEGVGRWRFPAKTLDETWHMAFDGLPYLGRFTSFRHTGVFPEQAAHWRDLERVIEAAQTSIGRPVRMLNLFGYTGIASLVGARAGAQVTHVDASRKAIGWAQDNQTMAGLDDRPIRWICDDAVKFCAREVRREQSYDIILLDPPSYGRGPKGEVWHLFDHLPHMLDLVRQLQSDTPLMTTLTSYAIRASSFALHEIMHEVFAGLEGEIQSGELVLKQEASERRLSTSIFSRFVGVRTAL